MSKLKNNIIQFAGENTKPYEQMKDYYAHYMSEVQNQPCGIYDSTVSLAEKDTKMHGALLSEIQRVSGVKFDASMPMVYWSTNPSFMWATKAVLGMMIDAVIPDTIFKSVGVFADIDYVDFGQTKQYDIEPNGLFTVSTGANGQRTAFRNRQFKTSKTLVAQNHQITAYVNMYAVLAGDVSLAEFARKMILSINTEMTLDAYNAIETLVAGGTFPSALAKTGYTQSTALELAQTVSAVNNGAKATFVGTAAALSNIIPNSALGYRINTPSDAMSIQLIKNFYDFDIMVLPQIAKADGSYALALNDKRIYVLSTGAQKIVRGIVEGQTMSNTNDFYDNADLTQNITMNKRWNFECCTNAVMGAITLS